MNIIIIYVALILSGLCMGSFAGASVWRLRARQLASDKRDGLEVDIHEYKKLNKLNKTSITSDHSRCLNCSYFLKWYDLIPLFSWLSLGGKCRKCRKPIGIMEPLIELAVVSFFVLSYIFWPHALTSPLAIIQFILWLAAGVGLAIMFVYDAKWFLLPDKVNFTVIGFGLLYTLIVIIQSHDKMTTLIDIIGSVFILCGIYLILYVISKGRWIGFGDVKLGLGLALLLVDWRLAFIALFSANLIGCIIVLPAMISGKLKRDSHVPFGPLLISGFVLAGIAGSYIVSMYMSFLLF